MPVPGKRSLSKSGRRIRRAAADAASFSSCFYGPFGVIFEVASTGSASAFTSFSCSFRIIGEVSCATSAFWFIHSQTSFQGSIRFKDQPLAKKILVEDYDFYITIAT